MPDHKHIWFTEQQTKHSFCSACGKHDPPDPRCPDHASALYAMFSHPKYSALKVLISELVEDFRARQKLN